MNQTGYLRFRVYLPLNLQVKFLLISVFLTEIDFQTSSSIQQQALPEAMWVISSMKVVIRRLRPSLSISVLHAIERLMKPFLYAIPCCFETWRCDCFFYNPPTIAPASLTACNHLKAVHFSKDLPQLNDS